METEPVDFVKEPTKQSMSEPAFAEEDAEKVMTVTDLETLHEIFKSVTQEMKRDFLTKDEFLKAFMSITIGIGTKSALEFFERIDVAKEGKVTWNQITEQMMLEYSQRDDKIRSSQIPEWKAIKSIPNSHREVIRQFTFVQNLGRYLAISKEGNVSLWLPDLHAPKLFKAQAESCRPKDSNVTGFTCLQSLNKVAVGFTTKEIAFYDLSAKLDFSCVYRLWGLPESPLNMDFWNNPDNPAEALLCWGDAGGWVHALFFLAANISLFERMSSDATDKAASISFKDVAADKFGYIRYAGYKAHNDWARNARYMPNLDCIITCATTDSGSLCIGWLEKFRSPKQIRLSKCSVEQGFLHFDFNTRLSLVATAGANHHICFWNPYVVSKPNGVLHGHMAPVVQVLFVDSRSQLISFSKDKVFRLWDIALQTCLQRIAGVFPKVPEPYVTLFYHEERQRFFLTFNSLISLLEMRAENRDRILTHDRPVVVLVYHASHRQVFTGSQDGNVAVWLVDTGQRLKQFYQMHGEYELTCLKVDHVGTRFFTGATDGLIKEWDLNGHCYHQFLCGNGGSAEVGDMMPLKRSLVAAGWTKYVTVFRDSEMRQFQVEPSDWKGGQEHLDDIVALATSSLNANLLVTGSCDGEIIIWNANTETTLRRLSERSRLRTRGDRGIARGTTESSGASRRSRAGARSRFAASFGGAGEDDFSYTVVKICFLDARRGDMGTASLLSCGGAGYVRAWNTGTGALVGEFIAHQGASSITMAVEPSSNNILATGDVEGTIKVWDLSNYCIQPTTSTVICTDLPPLLSQFRPHLDMITAIEVTERNERVCILTSSYDQTAQLWDTDGVKIGIFGQEDHWKIEKKVLKDEAEKPISRRDANSTSRGSDDSAALDIAPIQSHDSVVFDDSSSERINIWKDTMLGKEYEEARCRKRERPPLSLAMDTLSSQFSATTPNPTRGTFATLGLHHLHDASPISKPEFMRTGPILPVNKEEDPTAPPQAPRNKLPYGNDSSSLAGLKTVYDDKSLFPKYILEHEQKMHQQFQAILSKETEQKEKLPVNTAATSETGGLSSQRDSAVGRPRGLKGNTTKR